MIDLDQLLQDQANISNIVLAGDINIFILKQNDRQVSEYLSMLAGHGLVSLINAETRMYSCIDHIMVKTKQHSLALICNSPITDHLPTILSFLTIKNKASRKI